MAFEQEQAVVQGTARKLVWLGQESRAGAVPKPPRKPSMDSLGEVGLLEGLELRSEVYCRLK